MIKTIHLILVGASVRAAAQSAIRGGFRPFCLDLFGDSDLEAIAPVLRCPVADYPHGFRFLMQAMEPVPWLFTGGLENDPDLISALAQIRPLWGTDGPGLRRCRDPFHLYSELQTHSFPALEIQSTRPKDAESWLRKPFQGSGGKGITWAHRSTGDDSRYYYQRFQKGTSFGSVFLADGHLANYLGTTVQWIGEPWLHSHGFQYSGSWGPIRLSPLRIEQLQRLGNRLASSYTLRGFFGIDWIEAEDQVWLIEINPRYTASIEVLERAGNVSFFPLLQAIFERFELPAVPEIRPSVLCGKAILYAPHPVVIPANWPTDRADLADIPHPGETIETHWPICTFFASGHDGTTIQDRLQKRVEEISNQLGLHKITLSRPPSDKEKP